MPQPLDYGGPVPLFRRRRFRRAAVVLLLVAAAAAAAWHWGPPLYTRIRTAIWQKQCFDDALPPETVVFDSDPTAAQALLPRRGYTRIAPAAGQPDMIGRVVPSCGQVLFGDVPVPGDPYPLLFLHRLTTRGGQSRVVVLRLVIDRFPVPDKVIEPPMNVLVSIFDPNIVERGNGRTTFRADGLQRFDEECYGLWSALNARSLRLFAGQPDPADTSHFTIDYAIGDRRGTMDGWAEDPVPGAANAHLREPSRQWHLRLAVRDGPAKGGVTVDDAGDKFTPLYETDPTDAYARYLVSGQVTDFGVVSDARVKDSLVWRVKVTHVYSGRKDLLGRSFGTAGSLAAYSGQPDVPPVLRVGEEGIWWVSRGRPGTPDETIWADMEGEGRALVTPDYPAVVEWAQAVERVESAPPAERVQLLRTLSRHANHRIAEWAAEALPR